MSDMTRFKSLGKYEDWMFMNPSPTRILGEAEEENLKLNSESFFSSYILPIFTPSPSSITSTRVLPECESRGQEEQEILRSPCLQRQFMGPVLQVGGEVGESVKFTDFGGGN